MSDSTKNLLKIIAMVILAYIGFKFVVATTLLLLKLIIPIAIIGGIGYAIYRSSGGKALGGGRRTLP